MKQVVIIYATFPDAASAAMIGKVLVQEHLAACINILPPIQSIYEWEGRLEQTEEVAMIAKTIAGKEDALIARIGALHPYACPCIISWPIAAASEAFVEWVEKSTMQ